MLVVLGRFWARQALRAEQKHCRWSTGQQRFLQLSSHQASDLVVNCLTGLRVGHPKGRRAGKLGFID